MILKHMINVNILYRYNLELKNRFFKYILDIFSKSMSYQCDRRSLQKINWRFSDLVFDEFTEVIKTILILFCFHRYNTSNYSYNNDNEKIKSKNKFLNADSVPREIDIAWCTARDDRFEDFRFQKKLRKVSEGKYALGGAA